jgi:hypothetical protein
MKSLLQNANRGFKAGGSCHTCRKTETQLNAAKWLAVVANLEPGRECMEGSNKDDLL